MVHCDRLDMRVRSSQDDFSCLRARKSGRTKQGQTLVAKFACKCVRQVSRHFVRKVSIPQVECKAEASLYYLSAPILTQTEIAPFGFSLWFPFTPLQKRETPETNTSPKATTPAKKVPLKNRKSTLLFDLCVSSLEQIAIRKSTRPFGLKTVIHKV